MGQVEIYMIVTAVFMGFLGVWWDKSNLLNLCLKVLFISLAVWGAILAGHTAGFIIQIGG